MLLQGVRRDYKRAWQVLQRALLLSPGFPPALSTAALLMHTSFDQPSSALHMYQVLSRPRLRQIILTLYGNRVFKNT